MVLDYLSEGCIRPYQAAGLPLWAPLAELLFVPGGAHDSVPLMSSRRPLGRQVNRCGGVGVPLDVGAPRAQPGQLSGRDEVGEGRVVFLVTVLPHPHLPAAPLERGGETAPVQGCYEAVIDQLIKLVVVGEGAVLHLGAATPPVTEV